MTPRRWKVPVGPGAQEAATWLFVLSFLLPALGNPLIILAGLPIGFMLPRFWLTSERKSNPVMRERGAWW